MLLQKLNYRFEGGEVLSGFQLHLEIRIELRGFLNFKQILILPYGFRLRCCVWAKAAAKQEFFAIYRQLVVDRYRDSL
ncbi:hypothetical protein AL049_13250 [Pseudomonas syringae pv. cerasicola]|nr:hypothetical protein AL049_13250 [Pseudomonas syringae pv. cerasicola]PHN78522.1 hypothetical protein AO272_09150 [Pseudomonas syringae pv. cerasicola]PHN82308.1 hypothetical protein AO252_18670 [Pseudomonas syringae pv. cerasicola]